MTRNVLQGGFKEACFSNARSLQCFINLGDITACSKKKRAASDAADVTTVSPQLSLKRRGGKDGQKAERRTPQTPAEVSQHLDELHWSGFKSKIAMKTDH